MALEISRFSSLNFDGGRTPSYFLAPSYVQKFLSDDPITVQFSFDPTISAGRYSAVLENLDTGRETVQDPNFGLGNIAREAGSVFAGKIVYSAKYAIAETVAEMIAEEVRYIVAQSREASAGSRAASSGPSAGSILDSGKIWDIIDKNIQVSVDTQTQADLSDKIADIISEQGRNTSKDSLLEALLGENVIDEQTAEDLAREILDRVRETYLQSDLTEMFLRNDSIRLGESLVREIARDLTSLAMIDEYGEISAQDITQALMSVNAAGLRDDLADILTDQIADVIAQGDKNSEAIELAESAELAVRDITGAAIAANTALAISAEQSLAMAGELSHSVFYEGLLDLTAAAANIITTLGRRWYVTTFRAPVGRYRLLIRDNDFKTAAASASFCVCEDLENSVLFTYRHNKNFFDTLFLYSKSTLQIRLRLEADFLPQEMSFQVDAEDFRDQRYDLTQLSAYPYRKETLTVGGGFGVPNWAAEKLNLIFSLYKVLVDGQEYVRSEGSTPERTPIHQYYDRYIFKIELEPKGSYTVEAEEILWILSSGQWSDTGVWIDSGIWRNPGIIIG